MSLAEESATEGASLVPARRRVLTVADLQAGPRLTPKQIIRAIYDADKWEEFIEDWVKTLSPRYVKVERVGGANDKGVDVAAFVTKYGYEGDWDCYQCKYYKNALQPTQAREEIFKILRSVLEGHYTLPRQYRFVTPSGCSGSLSKLINSPEKFRADFLANIKQGKPLAVGVDTELLSQIEKYASSVDFSVFNMADLDDILDDLKGTPAYFRRFGTSLPDKPEPEQPPESPRPHEARYLEQLVEVHKENLGPVITCTADALAHPEASIHIRRERVAFYSAETLRVFARDNTLSSTFEALQDEIYDGVIDVHDSKHPSGYDRLRAVLIAATGLQITANALITVTELIERKGICHQLANDDRLRWCRGQS